MLINYLILLIAFFHLGTPVESNVETRGSGIDFVDLTWDEALLKAKKEQKNLFVYVYADWCGQCKKLKRSSFKDSDVGNYYNANFINIAINGETADGAKVLKNYSVRSYPTMLIVDPNGILKTKTSGVLKPYHLISFGRRIVPQ